MKNYPVKITDSAILDFDRLWDFLAEDSEQIADKRIDDIRSFCYEYFPMFPKMGKERNELKKGIRFFNHNNYNIFYSIRNEAVYIERVFHGNEDYESAFLNEDESL